MRKNLKIRTGGSKNPGIITIVGIPVIAEGVVAICYQTHVKRKRYVFVISLILILFVLFVPLGSCIFNALQFPFGRYTFVLLPIFTVVFSKGLDRICNEKRMSFLACGVATVGVIGLVAISAFILENDSAIRSYDKFIIVCNILTFVLIFLITKRKRNVWVYCFFLLIIVGCSVDNRVGNGNRETADNVMVVDRSETLEAVQNLQELDQSFFRIEKTYHDFTPWNDSLLEGYAPSTGYNSNIGRYIDLFYRNMWPEVINNGATRVTYAGEYIMEGGKEGKNNILTLLGVKYILSKERIKDMGEYYEEMEISEADIYVYRNLCANSVITGYDKVITESAFEELSREDRNAILGTYLVLDDEEAKESQYYTDAVNWSKNDVPFADNQYTMTLVKDTYFRGEVFIENDKMLFFSIPFREGWNIYIDGEQVETYRADYGFIACEISRGEHIIELRYENNIYLAGSLLSLIGVLIWVIGMRVTGRNSVLL